MASSTLTTDQRAQVAVFRAGLDECMTIDEQIWALVQKNQIDKAFQLSNVTELPHYLKALDAAAKFDASVTAERAAAPQADADQASRQIGVVADSAVDVSRNLDTVAAGSEQMGAAIGEISRNTTEAAMAAGSAVETVGQAGETVMRLGEASAQIAAMGSSEITENIAGVRAVADRTRDSAESSRAAAGELGRLSGALNDLTRSFRT